MDKRKAQTRTTPTSTSKSKPKMEQKFTLRSKEEKKLIKFGKRKQILITNTRFQKMNNRRYAWTQPVDSKLLPKNFIVVRERYRNSIKDLRRYPGADANIDHNYSCFYI